MRINENYSNLKENYLFTTIAKKVAEYEVGNPGKSIIRLGIGDVTRPLAPAVTEAMQRAVAEMGEASTFRGYGDEQGYGFLRRAVAGYYAKKGVSLRDVDVFISDGAKSDLGNILDIFAQDNTILIPDPVYPVYVDTNIMAGRKIIYSGGNECNGFLPMPDKNIKADIIYLCSPNNPTGAAYNKVQLKAWVDYANDNDSVILYDAAYEIFIQDDELPGSIYQIAGAKDCAIEFCSFSKTAGFTGTRCGYTIVPHELMRGGASINKLWLRRQTTKFNGVPYIVQRGAEAALSDAGLMQIKESIRFYQENARIISDTLISLGIYFTGGRNAPYIWLKCPAGLSSWEYFELLLSETWIVGTPGSGFGANGEGYMRLTAFGSREDTIGAMERLRSEQG